MSEDKERFLPIVRDQVLFPATFQDMMTQADVLVKSGLLPADVKSSAAAIAIMMTGRELDISPMQAFRSIYIVKGRPSLSAQLMAALIKRAGHDYHTDELTDQKCTITFTRRGGRPYTHMFTIEDAKRANLIGGDNWQKYPKSMLWSRCMSAGARIEMPDVIANMYTPEELAEPGQVIVGETGEIIDVKSATVTETAQTTTSQSTTTASTGGNGHDSAEATAAKQTWTTDKRYIIGFHAWLEDQGQKYGLNIDYETVKREALHVEHLAEYAGDREQAKAAVLAWIRYKTNQYAMPEGMENMPDPTASRR